MSVSGGTSWLITFEWEKFYHFCTWKKKKHGVVGLQGALITCFICDHQRHNCEHVTKVAESEETMEHRMWDFLVYFFAERNFQESTESVAVATTRKEWKIRSVSCLKKIPFHLSTTQKSILLWKRFFVAKCQLLIWCCLLPTCLPPAQSVHRSALVRLHKLCAFWKSRHGNVKVRNSLH